MCVCACVCVRAFVPACVHACVCACVRARVYYKHPCTSCNGGLTMGHEWIGPRYEAQGATKYEEKRMCFITISICNIIV